MESQKEAPAIGGTREALAEPKPAEPPAIGGEETKPVLHARLTLRSEVPMPWDSRDQRKTFDFPRDGRYDIEGGGGIDILTPNGWVLAIPASNVLLLAIPAGSDAAKADPKPASKRRPRRKKR